MSTHVCPRCDGEIGYQITEQRFRNLHTGNPNFWMNRLLMKTEAVYVEVMKCKACGEYMVDKTARDRKIAEKNREALKQGHEETLKSLMQQHDAKKRSNQRQRNRD